MERVWLKRITYAQSREKGRPWAAGNERDSSGTGVAKENYICSEQGEGGRGAREVSGTVMEQVWPKRITYTQGKEKGAVERGKSGGTVVERVWLKRITCAQSKERGAVDRGK